MRLVLMPGANGASTGPSLLTPATWLPAHPGAVAVLSLGCVGGELFRVRAGGAAPRRSLTAPEQVAAEIRVDQVAHRSHSVAVRPLSSGQDIRTVQRGVK
jgi:hypothetical protein